MSDLPVSFADRVKTKINEQISDLLPAEDISRLVDSQLHHFKAVDLPKMVNEMIAAEFKVRVKAEIDGPLFNQVWSGGSQPGAADLVKKILVDNSSEIFASAFQSMAMMVVQNMRNNRMI